MLDLTVTKPLPLAALPIGCKVLRVGHQAVKTLMDLRAFPSARRLWIQVANPAKPDRLLSDSSVEVLQLWGAICSSGNTFRTSFPHPLFACTAYADACADATCAGLGCFIRLPDDSCGCFQASFSPSELHELIATWGLLAQVGLLWTLVSILPVGHMPMRVVFRTDNSATDSASWKGLSMVLQAFFHLQEHVILFLCTLMQFQVFLTMRLISLIVSSLLPLLDFRLRASSRFLGVTF